MMITYLTVGLSKSTTDGTRNHPEGVARLVEVLLPQQVERIVELGPEQGPVSVPVPVPVPDMLVEALACLVVQASYQGLGNPWHSVGASFLSA